MSAKGLTSLLLVLIGSCALANAVGLNDSCLTQSGCYCQTSANHFIDLTPIGEFRFNLTDKAGSKNYAFQMCQSFTFGNCSSVYGCQYVEMGDEWNDIADSPPEFVNIRTIRYTASENKTTLVSVYCAINDSLTLTSSTDPKLTTFVLNTKYACPQPLTSTVTPQTTNTTATTATTTEHSNTTASNTTAHTNATTATSPTTTATSATTAASNSTSSPAAHNTTAPVTTTHVASTTHSGESMSRRPHNLGFIMAFVWLTNRLLSWR